MITLDRTVGAPEYKYGYLNLTTDNGVTQGHNFPPPNTPLTIITEGRQYLASMNTNPNQIWGGLRRWFRDENVYAGDKVRITYDTLRANVEGRAIVEIALIQRTEITEEIPATPIIQDEEEVERMAEVNMQMENDLENFLVENLHLIDKDLKLFQDEQGKSGRQYITEIGDIDLLCKKNNDFVVIELKKGRSSDKVVGQISRYIGWVKEKLANGNNVKGIIIVHDFDNKLKYAALANPNIELKYYKISIEFVTEQDVVKK
jgi:hypothetical protein